MENVKRSCILVLSIALLFGLLSACGQPEESVGQTEQESESSSIAATEATMAPTQAPTELQPELATAPDPDFYLNTAPDSTAGEYRVYSFKGNPTEAVQHYVSVLQDQYELTLVETYSDGSTLGWHLQRGSNENADVDVSINCTGGINWELWISFGNDVELTAAETWDKPILPTVSGPTLPDPGAFFGGISPVEDEPADASGWQVYYRTQIDEGYDAAHEYVKLLSDPRFGFSLTDSFDDTVLYLLEEYYFFDYTGDGNVEPVHDRYYNDGYVDFSADVFVWVQKNGRDEYTGIGVYYSSDLEVLDLGDRASTLPDYTDGNSNSDSFGDHNNSPQECNICRGTGECRTCHGDGYLWSSASDKEDRNCYKCHPNYGDCPYCNGTGWRD